MNNLKRIMELKKLDAIQLAKISGISVSNIRRILSDPQITPYKGTADILATALSVTPAQIYGIQPAALKDGELFTQRACDAAEELLRALNDYIDAPASISIYADKNLTGKRITGKDGIGYLYIFCADKEGSKIFRKAECVEFNEYGEPVFIKYLQDERRPE